MSIKIVVTGDVNGHLTEVFAKIAKLHEKQKFAFAIAVGNLFSADSESTASKDELAKLLNGEIEVPLPTYFALGNRELPATVVEKLRDGSGELCSNLFILGRKVSMKTSEGVQITAIGGAHQASDGDEVLDDAPFASSYTNKDIEGAKAFPDSHILVTSEWPADVTSKSRKPYEGTAHAEVRSLGDLCTALKPRYHFSSSEIFYEREPFYHSEQQKDRVTRFISLAPYNNPQSKEKKWIYAFSLNLEASSAVDGATSSPFIGVKRKGTKPVEDGQAENIRFGNGGNHYQHNQDHHHRKRHRGRHTHQPGSCFFCMAADSFEKHMVLSVGEHSYLTIAKGPLSDRKTFPALSGLPVHVLIIPVVHAPTISSITEDPVAVRDEMHKYREALQTMVAAKSTSGESGTASLGAVTWEISRARGVHIHWQFLPVPADTIRRGLVEAAFDVEAENQGIRHGGLVKAPEEIAKIVDGGDQDGSDYFRAMIWTEDGGRKDVVLPLDPEMKFNLQFGRQVMAKLLGLEKRMNWRDHAQSQEEENADCVALSKAFESYDPS